MKKLFLMAALVLGVSAMGLAQFRKIPAVVTEAFKDKFPNASQVEWKDKLSLFRAFFREEGVNYSAAFNSRGEWQDTETYTDEDELPEAVKEGLEKSKYADRELTEVVEIEKANGDKLYRLRVKKSDIEKKYLFFNEEGRLIKEALTL